LISGKATVEIAGEHAESVVRENRPEFYFQLSRQQSFGIVKVTPQKNIRVVEHVEILPVVKEYVETRDLVQTFTKQLSGDDFYKIWPQEPLPAGEYALIEYQDGKLDMRVWDFRIE
jgi:hypothetical protein